MDRTFAFKPLLFLASSSVRFLRFCRNCSGFKRIRFSACHLAVENYQPPPAFDAPGSGSFPPPALSRILKYFRWLRGRPAQGFPAQNFGQHAPRENPEGVRPSEKPLLTLTLSEAELKDLRFAVYCHVGEILDSDEADHPEVVPHIDRYNAILERLIELEKGLQP
jgi:hypothetical protein